MKTIDTNVYDYNSSCIGTVSNDLVFRDATTSKSIGYVDRISTTIDPFEGFSAEITVTDRKVYDQIVNSYTDRKVYDQIVNSYMRGSREAEHVTPRKYQIKKVVVNPKKNATTVIFEDGEVVVVKKSPDDPEADIFAVVAQAVAKRIYGTNSAFKREVLKNLDFIDREFEQIIDRTPVTDLEKALKSIAKHLRGSKGDKE